MTYRELAELLRAHGCEFDRQGKGDHEIWFSPITNRPFSVPRKLMGEGTLRQILKDAGLPHPKARQS